MFSWKYHLSIVGLDPNIFRKKIAWVTVIFCRCYIYIYIYIYICICIYIYIYINKQTKKEDKCDVGRSEPVQPAL